MAITVVPITTTLLHSFILLLITVVVSEYLTKYANTNEVLSGFKTPTDSI